MKALIFDCDGVIADTERDGHRVAFNKAFEKLKIDANWDVQLYKELLKVGGGKERMRHYFDEYGWPEMAEDKDSLIKEIHKFKTDLFMDLIESGSIPVRPGLTRLIDEAIEAEMQLAVCSTSNERAVNLIVDKLIGKERKKHFKAILAGDIVSKKKPDPEIYNLCCDKLNVLPNECLVVEDNRNGLRAAKGAGMYCLVTYNDFSKDEDFKEADKIVPELGDNPVRVSIRDCMEIVDNNIKI